MNSLTNGGLRSTLTELLVPLRIDMGVVGSSSLVMLYRGATNPLLVLKAYWGDGLEVGFLSIPVVSSGLIDEPHTYFHPPKPCWRDT